MRVTIKANKLEGSPTRRNQDMHCWRRHRPILHDKNNAKLQASCRHVTRDRMYDSGSNSLPEIAGIATQSRLRLKNSAVFVLAMKSTPETQILEAGLRNSLALTSVDC